MVLTTITEPRRVIAIDPGVTTGFANGLLLATGMMEVSSFQERFGVKDLFDYLTTAKPHYVVYERFDYRNRARDKLVLYSRNLIGVIDLYCEQQAIPTYRYMPVTVMAYFTDKELRANQVYKVNSPHCNDAMRHLLHWYTFGFGYQFNHKGYKPA